MGLESFPIQLLSVPFCLLAAALPGLFRTHGWRSHSILCFPLFPFFFPKITCQSRACFQCVGAQIRRECQGQADSKGRDNNPWLLFPLWNCWVYQIRDWGLSKAFGSQKVPHSHSQLGFSSEEVGEMPGNYTIPSGGNGGGNVAPLSPSRPPGHTFWLLCCWERFSVWKIPLGSGEAGNLSPAQTSRIISHSCNSLVNILQAKGMKSHSPPPCARGQILDLLSIQPGAGNLPLGCISCFCTSLFLFQGSAAPEKGWIQGEALDLGLEG